MPRDEVLTMYMSESAFRSYVANEFLRILSGEESRSLYGMHLDVRVSEVDEWSCEDDEGTLWRW